MTFEEFKLNLLLMDFIEVPKGANDYKWVNPKGERVIFNFRDPNMHFLPLSYKISLRNSIRVPQGDFATLIKKMGKYIDS